MNAIAQKQTNASKSIKSTTTPKMKDVLGNLKDVGLIGSIIYILWFDNDKNKADIAALKEANAAMMSRIEIQQINYDHLNKQMDNVDEKIDVLIEKLNNK